MKVTVHKLRSTVNWRTGKVISTVVKEEIDEVVAVEIPVKNVLLAQENDFEAKGRIIVVPHRKYTEVFLVADRRRIPKEELEQFLKALGEGT